MEQFYHSSDGFLILRVQNMCVEAILISLNPYLTEFSSDDIVIIYHQY